uniref:Uncharacterized protein n=1 Tax=Rhodosorus marinus TaxID=101924 RepID=A0A7S2ZQL0_9RHOD|mmetsp:Transcript_28572/g.111812  ORF Transcript_28572/g.111812 Transcript_28572/m.111812 type:complete len:126 (+) Transcript_28572:140-517(+)|eukprot:CAMPEP_0113956872 /NCGR_PEP_ID=MMETSP0011_2-20120614/2347_1 /TAXON_ID=101924 /ORGANISM="Rhodosorus marinus" /LENGTH=125 /DNA_ID=CAMNT_0000967155 /DNA_START=82 /DNA_END=459 /DNA_ORIENTATION=- /assembly_acc=CAM_ASM_000156
MSFGPFRATIQAMHRNRKADSAVKLHTGLTKAGKRNTRQRMAIVFKNMRILNQGKDTLEHLNNEVAQKEGMERKDYVVLSSYNKFMSITNKAGRKIHQGHDKDFPGVYRFRKRPPDFSEYKPDKV